MIDLDYIDINKSLIPYTFDITLEGETYTFDVNYNSLYDFFTVDLIKNDDVIVLGEKLIHGKPLFLSATHKDIPKTTIIPFDISGATERITFDNLNRDVFLYMVGD